MGEKVEEYGSGLAGLRRDIQELYTSLPALSAYTPRPPNSDCLQQPPPRSRVSSLSEIPNWSREREITTEQPSASTSNVPDWNRQLLRLHMRMLTVTGTMYCDLLTMTSSVTLHNEPIPSLSQGLERGAATVSRRR